MERLPDDPFFCNDAMDEGVGSHIKGGIKGFHAFGSDGVATKMGHFFDISLLNRYLFSGT